MKTDFIISLLLLLALIQFGCVSGLDTAKTKTGAIAGIAKDLTNLDLKFRSNVIIENTKFGCSTSENGKFLILNIPIGFL